MKDQTDLQAIAEGWQWLQNVVLSITSMHRGEGSTVQELAQIADEVLALSTATYSGQGLSTRLDRSVEQARALLQGAIDEQACRDFLDDIDADVRLAASAASKEDHEKWKD